MTRVETLETSHQAVVIRGEFEFLIRPQGALLSIVDEGENDELTLRTSSQWGPVAIVIHSGGEAAPPDATGALTFAYEAFDEVVVEEVVPGGAVVLTEEGGQFEVVMWRGQTEGSEADRFEFVITAR